MVFIERDDNGEIVALHRSATQEAGEELGIINREVIEFLGAEPGNDSLTEALANSDLETVRVIEDVIDLLIQKKILLLTELPVAAQEKLRSRRVIRKKLAEQDFMLGEDEIL